MALKQFFDDIQFLGRTYFTVLSDKTIQTSKGIAVPNVSGLNMLVFNSTTPQNVTNFMGGADGQNLKVIGDGQTTVKNNTTIKTNVFGDKLLLAVCYEFIYYNGIWYEQD